MLGTIVGMIFISLIYWALGSFYEDGYIDAITGNIKMELITHPDSTKTWEWIKK